MPLDLPESISAYFAAEGADSDVAAFRRWFVEDALVKDEGETHKGLAAIAQWKAEARKKYQYTLEPLASAGKGGKVSVTCRIAGNFPGSPVDLQYDFELKGGKIASLAIHP